MIFLTTQFYLILLNIKISFHDHGNNYNSVGIILNSNSVKKNFLWIFSTIIYLNTILLEFLNLL
jgi:hypothetical protein